MSKILMFLAAMFFAASANATFQCTNANTKNTMTWSVGQPKPSMNIAGDANGISCMASGDELKYIQSRFTGHETGAPLLVNGSATVIWRGKDAVFILDNM